MSSNNSPTERDESTAERDAYWFRTASGPPYDPLETDVRADVAVVGAGIAGLTAALELAEAGRDVAVIERDRVGEGVTARSSAKVTSLHGFRYASLVEEFDEETARGYAAANEAAVDYVERRCEAADADVGFRRLPAYSYVEDDSERETVESEFEAARRAGLSASLVEEIPVSEDAVGAVRVDDQAQFDPRAYLFALAEAVDDAGGVVFERTRATDLDAGEPHRVRTERGNVVADDVVVATHFPVFDRGGYFARQTPKHSLVVGVRVADPPTEAHFYRESEPYLSIRSAGASADDEPIVLVGGQSHQTGKGGSVRERYERLERQAREHFDVESVECRWSTQDFTPIDDLPYAGEMGPVSDGVYVATGFDGWGMTNGTAAGRIIADLIRDEPNPHADVFDPNRFSLSAAGDFAKENAEVAKSFAGDWVTKPRAEEVRNLDVDEATVLREGSDVRGVYRDDGGDVHAVSAVCPHMGCLVEWNDGDRTWDCPCHGSRFDYEGGVVDGPAVEDLPSAPESESDGSAPESDD
ncbi:FAD-dependent oxidoreductase [Halogeometricum luteum]|uniref:FAD-dependent oxidoreductase n=1 Tax=Halogeometricum luteum TaxID=2950537 RepID=A0ABU2G6Y4_9EURY|nr:FAD-dependent oxidoreductase [Halogeometricum sp. S3BR5-2]MDS0296059.1 FAD-dependent oxidoreductase [Halogeometricum sp. S3BR5-2]